MNKSFALKILLVAFCATVESGIVTINFPDDDFDLRLLNGTLQLSTKNNQVIIRTPTSNSSVHDFSSVAIRNFGNNYPSPLGENNRRTKVANNDQLLLKGSKKLDEWLNASHIFSAADFSLFNVTDTQHLIGDSIKEVGPFQFFEKRYYEVQGWSDDEKYVEVKQRKSYSFIGNVTQPLEERITVLNVPLMIMFRALRDTDHRKRPSIGRLAKPILDKLPLFVNLKVKDLLFGYSDETLSKVPEIDAIFRKYDQKLVLPDSIQNGRYSVVRSKNNVTHTFKVNTGKDNIKNLGQIVAVNGFDTNPAWRDDMPFNCTLIEGSDGQLRAPLDEQDRSIKIFIPEFDRPVQYDEVPYNKTINNGQKVRRYALSPNVFKSSMNYAPNGCYHNYPYLSYEDYDGIFTKSRKMAKNEHIVFSKPNFLDADSSVTTDFYTSLRPDKQKHESFVEINEQTGETVFEHRALQVNIDTASINEKITRLFFPIYYSREYTFITNQKYDK